MSFDYKPLTDAVKAPPAEEFTEEEMAVMNLGIGANFVRIWYQLGPGKEGKKVFKYDKYLAKNITKGFLDFVIDRLSYTGLKQVDVEQLPEKLGDMVITTLDGIKRDATEKPIVDVGLKKQLDNAFKEIAKLQAMVENAQSQTQKALSLEDGDLFTMETLIKERDTAIQNRAIENSEMERYKEAVITCVQIFAKNNITEDVSEEVEKTMREVMT